MAKFEKGNKLGAKSKPGKHAKTKQWEALGDAIVGKHSEAFNSIMEGYLEEGENKKFLDAYLQVLNYFKPKYSSTTIDSDSGINIKVNIPGSE